MSDLHALLHELDRGPGCPACKRHVRQLLGTFAGQRLYFAKSQLLKPEQVRMAQAMLSAGMERADIARALMERLQVSEATAYRLIARALDAQRHRQIGLGL